MADSVKHLAELESRAQLAFLQVGVSGSAGVLAKALLEDRVVAQGLSGMRRSVIHGFNGNCQDEPLFVRSRTMCSSRLVICLRYGLGAVWKTENATKDCSTRTIFDFALNSAFPHSTTVARLRLRNLYVATHMSTNINMKLHYFLKETLINAVSYTWIWLFSCELLSLQNCSTSAKLSAVDRGPFFFFHLKTSACLRLLEVLNFWRKPSIQPKLLRNLFKVARIQGTPSSERRVQAGWVSHFEPVSSCPLSFRSGVQKWGPSPLPFLPQNVLGPGPWPDTSWNVVWPTNHGCGSVYKNVSVASIVRLKMWWRIKSCTGSYVSVQNCTESSTRPSDANSKIRKRKGSLFVAEWRLWPLFTAPCSSQRRGRKRHSAVIIISSKFLDSLAPHPRRLDRWKMKWKR